MINEKKYDVVIVGGGLAGLCLAIQCARAHFSVVVFEKEAYPFHKVCGEYISNESRQFLEQLGVPVSNLKLPDINQLQVSDVFGKMVELPLGLGGFGISRYMLDFKLYEIAKNAGVEFYTNIKVQNVHFNGDFFKTDAGEIQVKSAVVAGSYGKRSNLDVKFKRPFIFKRSGGLNNYIGVKYHLKYPQPASQISLHNFKNGYCGISNIEDEKCCLAYLTTAENLRKCHNSIKEMEEHVLAKNPLLKNIFSTADFLYDTPLTISQISFEKKEQVVRHVLMIGDAAGMITPLCGNGMSMAMHGSKIAAGIIQQFLSGRINRNEMEVRYIKEWNKQFASRLFVGRSIQQLFGGNISTAVFLRTMKALPALANSLIKLTHGKSF